MQRRERQPPDDVSGREIGLRPIGRLNANAGAHPRRLSHLRGARGAARARADSLVSAERGYPADEVADRSPTPSAPLPTRSVARQAFALMAPMLAVPGALSLLTLPACVACGWRCVAAFATTFGVSALAYGALRAAFGPADGSIPVPTRMVAVAGGWLTVAAIGMIPFVVIGYGGGAQAGRYADLQNAFFESMSAFTSTGLSMASRPSELPAPLQLWRSLGQWVGGLGMTVFVYVVARPDDDAFGVMRAELSAPVEAEPPDAFRHLLAIYGGLSAFAVALFAGLGMPPWEALNHGLTGIATAGMTVTDDSFQSYPTELKIAGMLVMTLGGISMVSYHLLLFRRRWRALLRRTELRLLVGLLALGGCITALAHLRIAAGGSALDAAFTWTSALTTCGFSAVDVAAYPAPLLLLLGGAMIVGAESGSTSGGIKARRLAWLLEGIVGRVAWESTQESRQPVYRFDGERVEDAEATRQMQSAAVTTTLWLTLIAGAAVTAQLVSPSAAPFDDVLFDCASALGGVGLSAGWVSSGMPDASKVGLALLMWMGRLEILAVLVLLLTPLRRRLARRLTRSEE
ncbi:MAG TPA: hypothetical protein DEF51_41920 [Myxococcales bacterium]|nr:hypothetical protein [Myxococcales bacterium]